MSNLSIPVATRHRLRRALPLALAAATAAAVFMPTGKSSAATPQTSEGVACETDANNAFNLTATSGYVATPDGNSIYNWSYTDTGNAFQFPGPTLCVTSGQKVTVVLHNNLREDTSILFPGQNQVQADGAPSQPQFSGTNLTSLTTAASANGGSVTYSFTAGSPGTYLYQSGTDVKKQVQMGLYGALVVRPAGHPDWANSRSDSAFNPDKEYVYVLSDLDPSLHLAVERNRAFNWAAFRPRYFLINGRSMPDTLAPNFAAWLPNQPYGGLVHIRPYDATNNPNPALIRYLNAGEVNFPFHPHGADQLVITRDGHPLQGPSGGDTAYNKFLIDAGPGQTWDTLLSWKDVEHWDPNSNPIPVPLPELQDQIVGPGTDTWFSENPYLGGGTNPVPQGIIQNNECGEYYHISHSHALEQATNFGASFGGMMTLIRIDPPTGCPAN